MRPRRPRTVARLRTIVTLLCLFLLVAPSAALALTSVSASWDTVPPDWTAEERTPPDVPNYDLSITISQDTPEGTPAYHASVLVFQGPERYETMDAFMAAWDMPTVEQNLAGDSMGIPTASQFSGTDSGTTQIKGYDALYTSYTQLSTPDGFSEPVDTTRATTYWIDLGDSGLTIHLTAGVRRGYEDQLEPLWSQTMAIWDSMQINTDGASGATPQPTEGGAPWRNVVGGIAAVAAAATALAGAAAASASSRGEKPDPDHPIGYVLQLSTQQLHVSEEQSAPLTATVHEVFPDGHFQIATGARIQLTTPAGAAADPATGTGTMQTLVWQTGPVSRGALMRIQASAALGATSASVALMPQDKTEIAVRFDPEESRELFANGRDSVTVVATVGLGALDNSQSGIDPNVVRSTIAFSSLSEWLDLSSAVDWHDGKAIRIEASQPDPNHPVQPPESAVVNVTARVGERTLSDSITIPLARFPVIDAAPDTVELGAETGDTAEVKVWIDHAGGLEWSFGTRWREGDPHVAYSEVDQTNPHMCVVKLAEDATGKLDPALPEQAFTLIVKASAANMDDIERHLKVVISQEGVFVDRVGKHPDGTFHIDATGGAKPTEIDVRVFARDTDGKIAPQPNLAQQAEWTPGGDASSAGHAVLGYDEFNHHFTRMRGVENPSATFKFSMGRMLPTSGDPIPAQLQVSIPGQDKPFFTKLVPVSLDGVDTSPYSDSWNLERERCLQIINEFVPAADRAKLIALVNERGKTMGAEGLYELRHRIYDYANTLMMKQVADYLDEAWWNEQVEGFLDWVSWCGDIAMSVATGRITGTVAGIAVGMLKPVLVSAVNAWVEGKSLDEWVWEQIEMAGLVIEGQWTDVDFLTKITGNRRALAWAICISYNFVRNLGRGLSVTEAMKETARMIRDEMLVTFLRGHAGTRPQDAPDTDGTGKRTSTGDADAETATRKKAPDGPDARARGRKAAEKVHEGSTRRGGKDYADPETTLEIMRDPDAAREMRRNNPAAYEAYTNTRTEMQTQHDSRLIEALKGRPEYKDKKIRVATVGTEGGIDRDYRVLQEVPDPRHPGQMMEIEVPRSEWADDSHRIFAEQTGGPTDPKGAAEHAHRHQQVATDGYHAEAATDMADQAWHTDPETGRRERVQVEPQRDVVKRGEGTLHNPDEYGRTWANKVTESASAGELDGYTQAAKASRELRAIRKGYELQQYDVGALDPKLKQGMKIIERVANGDMTPAEGNRALAQNNLGDLHSMANKLSAQFSALGQATKKS